jgi:phage internal scaffolding protein
MCFQTRFSRKPQKGLEFDPSLDQVKQEFKEETDINLIVSSYMKTGSVPGARAFTQRFPQFGDFSGVRDLSDALRFADESKEAFMSLPVKVRERFHNNVSELHSFIMDENNRPEAERLGLVEIKERPVEDQPPIISVNQPEAGETGAVTQ